MKLCGIYLLTHIETGRKYVGQSVDIKKRWYQHSLGLCGMRLGRTIARDGWSAFIAEVLELCERDDLNAAECRWIKHFGCMSPQGFNLTAGGKQNTEVSDETKAALSAARLGAKTSEATKEKLRLAAQSRGDEYKAKISAANQRRAYTAELVEKLGSGNRGRAFSSEHRAKISLANKNRAPTFTGKTHTEESRAKMSASRVGKKQSPERIAKAVAAKAAARLLRNVGTAPA